MVDCINLIHPGPGRSRTVSLLRLEEDIESLKGRYMEKQSREQCETRTSNVRDRQELGVLERRLFQL